MDYLIFDTEAEAIEAEAAISLSMELPSEKGDRWDIPELREFDGKMKWSIIKPKELFNQLTGIGTADKFIEGRYIRITEETDPDGNPIFEEQKNPLLSDGTILTSFNKELYDGEEGWEWYEGEVGIVESPSTWETIKNWFKL